MSDPVARLNAAPARLKIRVGLKGPPVTWHRPGPILISLGVGLVFSFALGLVGAAPVRAQEAGPTEPAAEAKVGKVLRAFRITGSPPQIDGLLDDEVWGVADIIDDLIQVEPDNEMPPSERTVVQVAFDDRALYVAVRAYDREPSEIVTALGRRDSRPPADHVMISFDPRHDHLNAYVFEVNVSGVQRDYTFFDDTRSTMDYN